MSEKKRAKTISRINPIWKKFIDTEMNDFKEYHGYGTFEIIVTGFRSISKDFNRKFPIDEVLDLDNPSELTKEATLFMGKRTGIMRKSIDKFLNFMGWMTDEDVSKWRTNLWHVHPCAACKSEYAIMEDEFCICETCRPIFDQKKITRALKEGPKVFVEDIPDIEDKNYLGLTYYVIHNKELRDKLRKD